MATCFDTKYIGRPCLLLLVWIFGIIAALFLLFGMMIDELTVASFKVQSSEYSLTCQSSTFDTVPGGLDVKYTDVGFTQALLQKQAGSAWLAFGILACLFLPFLLFGIITDYYSGIFDNKKPINYFKGCCMLQTWGFTKISILFIMLLTLLQIIAFSAADKCSELIEEIYDGGQTELSTIGGASFVMVVMSFLFLLAIPILILYYQYRISEELPSGEKKKAPVKFQAYPDGVERPKPKPPKEPTPPPMEATGQAPQSEYFQPKRNITKGGKNRNMSTATTTTIMSEGDFSGANKGNNTGNNDRALSMLAGGQSVRDGHKTTKPKSPPPIPKPKPKPKGPPPVPSDALR